MNRFILYISFILCFVFASSASADSSAKTRAEKVLAETLKNQDDVQVVKACDGRKRVVVEGFKEGERLPEEKARQVARLLTRLMDYCDQEFVAVIPQNRIEILLSLNGEPFITVDNTDLKLPLTLVHGGQSHSKREMSIWRAEEEKLIADGYKLFHSQLTSKNGISCDMCHPDASNTHPETYPKFQTQMKKVVLLRDMINWCILNPMEGNPLSDDDERMKALEAYILSTRKGVSLDYGRH